MKTTQIINIGIKYLLSTLVTLASVASYSYAEGFYVIPVVKEVIEEVDVIKEVEVCTGLSTGQKVFELVVRTTDHIPCVPIHKGEIFKTKAGSLVLITGTNGYYHGYCSGDAFYLAPNALPNPSSGVKGPFFSLNNGGDTVFAKYL